jgi:hypothetical protein
MFHTIFASQNNFKTIRTILLILSFTLIIQLANAAPRRANTGRIKGTIIEKGTSEVASIKVRSAVILEMLKLLQLGTAHNDLTKICKLISFLTGNSYNSIYNELQKGVFFSNYHKKQIDEANKILAELNASISIDKNKQY